MADDDRFEWCRLLSVYALDYRKDGEQAYRELVEMIRGAADGAFDICDSAPCRNWRGCISVLQVKDLPWDYLYRCMMISGKDFRIKHLPTIADGVPDDGDSRIFAWHDSETDGVKVIAYTGNVEQEENSAPAYDGYGRFTTRFEIVEATVSPDGNSWIERPRRRFVNLYG